MATAPGSPVIDPADFDAVGVLADLVVAVRIGAIERERDVVATISAPPGRHRLQIVGRRSGHVVLAVRYDQLSLSRRNVVAEALDRRDWDLDEDEEGATRRYPPGTEGTTVAFEALGVLTVGGTPAVARSVEILDAGAGPVERG